MAFSAADLRKELRANTNNFTAADLRRNFQQGLIAPTTTQKDMGPVLNKPAAWTPQSYDYNNALNRFNGAVLTEAMKQTASQNMNAAESAIIGADTAQRFVATPNKNTAANPFQVENALQTPIDTQSSYAYQVKASDKYKGMTYDELKKINSDLYANKPLTPNQQGLPTEYDPRYASVYNEYQRAQAQYEGETKAVQKAIGDYFTKPIQSEAYEETANKGAQNTSNLFRQPEGGFFRGVGMALRGNPLNQATDEEKKLADYWYGVSKEAGDEYYKWLLNILSARSAGDIATNADTFGESIGLAAIGGLDQFFSGVINTVSMATKSDNVYQGVLSQANQQNIAQIAKDSWLGKIGLQLITTVANMAPSILIGSATGNPLIGSASMGVSASGNAYTQAIISGADPLEAAVYGLLVGASETTLQYFMSKIPGVSKAGGVLATKIDDAIKAVASNQTVINVLEGAAKFMYSAGAEGLEEFLQEIIDPILQNAILNQDADIDLVAALEAGLIGALSGGAFSIPGSISQARKNNAQQQQSAQAPAPVQPVAPTQPEAPAVTAKPADAQGIAQSLKSTGEISAAQIDTIVKSPDNRAVFTQETGVELPAAVGDARRAIRAYQADINSTQANTAAQTATINADATAAQTRVDAPPAQTAAVEPVNAVYGKTGKTYTKDNDAINFTYAVVDVNDLITSNDIYGNVNPNYPVELQPRDRTRVASQAQVQEISKKLNPELLGASPTAQNGAPIIGADGVVEGGNGRVNAIALAYQTKGAKNYRQYIIDNAAEYGIDASRLPANPVLVRVNASTESRADVAKKLNQSTISTYSSTESALTDASKISTILDDFVPNDDGTINTADNKKFISRFINEVAPASERNSLVTSDGWLSQAGLERVKNAIFAAVYNDAGLLARLSENLDDNSKNVIRALLNTASNALSIKNRIENGILYDIDLSGDVLQAARLYEQLKRNGTEIEDYFAQSALLDDGYSDEAKVLAWFFSKHKRGAKAMSAFINTIYQTVEDLGSPNQITLGDESFGADETKASVLESAIRSYERENGETLSVPEFQRKDSTISATETLGENPQSTVNAQEARMTPEENQANNDAITVRAVSKDLKQFGEMYDFHFDTILKTNATRKIFEDITGVKLPLDRELAIKAIRRYINKVKKTIEAEYGSTIGLSMEERMAKTYGKYGPYNPFDLGSKPAKINALLYSYGIDPMENKVVLDMVFEADDLIRSYDNISIEAVAQAIYETYEKYKDQAIYHMTEVFDRGFELDGSIQPDWYKEEYHPTPEQVKKQQEANKRYIKEMDAYKKLNDRINGKRAQESATPKTAPQTATAVTERPAQTDTDTDAEIAENKVGEGDVWQTTRIGTDEDVKSLTQIVKQAYTDLDIPIIRGGIRGRRSVQGQYRTASQTIHVRTNNDILTIAHEVGHHLDTQHGLVSTASPAARQELLNNLSPGMTAAYKANQLPAEGVAEFFRYYFTNADEANAAYPEFSAHVESKLPAETLGILNRLASSMNTYLSAPVYEQYLSAVSMSTDNAPTLAEKWQGVKDKFTEYFIDNLAGIKRFGDAVENTRSYILAQNSLYASGTVDALLKTELRDMNGKYIGESLLKAVEDINVKDAAELRAFNLYLILKHAPERIGDMKKVFANPELESQANIDASVAKLEAQYPSFASASDRVYQFQKNLLKAYGVDSGLISQKVADEWDKKYPHYIPLQRDLSNTKKKSAKNATSKVNQSLSPFKAAKGSGLDILAPLEGIVWNTNRMVLAAKSNAVRIATTEAAATTEGAGKFLEREKAPTEIKRFNAIELKANTIEALKNNTGVDENVLKNVIDSVIEDTLEQYTRSSKIQDNIMLVMKNGEPQYWRVNDTMLLHSLENVGIQTVKGFWDAYGKVTRVITQAATGGNVIWSIFSNALRDIQTGAIYDRSGKTGKWLLNIGKAYYQQVTDKAAREKGLTPSRMSEYYREYLSLGGANNISRISADRADTAKSFSGLLSKKQYLNPFDAIASVSDIIEQAPRFAEYASLREKGTKATNAFYQAMDVTVNFRRGGTWSRQINKAIPFFNASIQGLDKMFRNFTAADVPVSSRKKIMTRRFAKYAALSAIVAFAQIVPKLFDEDEKKDYEQLSAYQKNGAYNIYLGDGKFFSIRKPRELGILTSFFERTMEYALLTNKDAYYDFASYASEQLLPPLLDVLPLVASGDMDAVGGSLASTFGAAGSLFALTLNVDYRGNPIVSEALGRLQPKFQYDESTSFLAKTLGGVLNLSPKKIDYVLNTWLGMYQTVNKSLFPVGNAERDWTLGVANTYVKDNQYSQDIVNKFYTGKTTTDKNSASYPDKPAYKIQSKDYGSMAQFYSNTVKIAQNTDMTTPSNRAARQTVLEMLEQFSTEIDGGNASPTKQSMDKLAAETGDTSFYPQTMGVVFTYTPNKGNRVEIALTYTQYLQYQTAYNAYYYNEVGKALNKSYKNADDKMSAVQKAKREAKEKIDKEMFSLLTGRK